ncbi:hypothetical protein ACFY00_34330 [Kitasatospora sp. NPDC001540]|uniref:hypothetical protein n=1 Tax=Kitasatospora sp. NPDC001540 TaxID=3364014 RepID=UPI0036925872
MESYATSAFGIGGYFNGVRAARDEVRANRRAPQWLHPHTEPNQHPAVEPGQLRGR